MATVLVVHDDTLSQRTLSRVVATAGHGCLHAASEDAALRLLRERGLVDVVLIDAEAMGNRGDALLRAVREDPVFSGIPVVVLLGQAERATIFRYAELGVQAMLAKPIKGDAINEEIAKAVKADWTAKLIEPTAAALSRLKLPIEEYHTLLGSAAKTVGDAVAEFRKSPPVSPEDDRAKRFLKPLINLASDLGIPGLRGAAASAGKGLASVDEAQIKRGLLAAETLATLMRRRVHTYLQVHDRSDQPPERPVPPLAGTARPTDFARSTTAKALHAMGGNLGRLGKRLAPDEAEWSGHISYQRYEGPMAVLADVLRRVADAASSGREEVARALEEEPGLLDVFLTLAHRLGEFTDDVEVDAMLAVDRVGVDRALLLAHCGRFLKASKVDSPLDLVPLRRHTVVQAVLAYEIASILRLGDRHLAAAASLGASAGVWLAAVAEPLMFGLALAETATGTVSAGEIEKRLLGATLGQIGIQYLDTTRAHEAVREVHRARVRGIGATEGRWTGHVVVCVLAEVLAWAAIDADEKALDQALEPWTHPEAPGWQWWQKAGLKLPLGAPELCAALKPEARTALWIADTLLLWADTIPAKKK